MNFVGQALVPAFTAKLTLDGEIAYGAALASGHRLTTRRAGLLRRGRTLASSPHGAIALLDFPCLSGRLKSGDALRTSYDP